jgi:hypothetical protein
MRTFTIILYFLFAIGFLSAIGVIVPYLIDSTNNDANAINNLNQNLITYGIAILVSASLDYILQLIDKSVSYKKAVMLLVIIGNVGILIIYSFILIQLNKTPNNEISKFIVFGIFIAYVMWWIANYKNANFDIINTATLGGDPNKPLTNGK